MVFETLKEWLIHISDTVSKPLDQLAYASTGLKQEFFGPDISLEERIDDLTRYQPLLHIWKIQARRIDKQLQKQSITASHRQQIQACITSCITHWQNTQTFAELCDIITQPLETYANHIAKKEWPLGYTWTSFTLSKKRLKQQDRNTILTTIQEWQIDMDMAINHYKKSFTSQYLIPYTQESIPAYEDHTILLRDLWKTHLLDIVWLSHEHKQLEIESNELKKQIRLLDKAQSEKRSGDTTGEIKRRIQLATQTIDVLINKKLLWRHRALHDKIEQYKMQKKELHDVYDNLDKSHTIRQKKYMTYIKNNTTKTAKTLKQQQKKMKQSQNKTRTIYKKIDSLLVIHSDALWSIESTHTQKKIHSLQHTLLSHIQSIHKHTLDTCSIYNVIVSHHKKDILLLQSYIQKQTNYYHQYIIAQKERILQLKIKRQYIKKLETTANHLRHILLDAQPPQVNNVPRMTKEALWYKTYFKKERILIEKEIGSITTQIKQAHVQLKEFALHQETSTSCKDWLHSRYRQNVHSYYTALSKKNKHIVKQFSKQHKEYSKTLTQLIKTTQTQHEKLEQISSTKLTKKQEKERAILATRIDHYDKLIHHYEDFHAVLEHHIDSYKHTITYYQKLVKKEQKTQHDMRKLYAYHRQKSSKQKHTHFSFHSPKHWDKKECMLDIEDI